MPVPFTQAVSVLVEEFSQKLLDLLPAAAAAELDALKFELGSIPSTESAAANAPDRTTRSPGAKAPRAKSGRPKADRSGRPSSQEASQTLEAIATLLREKPGIGGEEICRALGRTSDEVRSALALGVWTNVLRSERENEAETYFAGPGGGRADAHAPAEKTKPSHKR